MTAALASRPGVTPRRVIESEWIKLRSLRSTWFGLGAAMLISIGLGALFADLRGNDYATHRGGAKFDVFDATQVSLRGIHLAQLVVGVLGVLLITGEYSTGMIRASLVAVPKRTPVFAAKVAVFGVLTYLTMTAMTLLAFLAGQALLDGNGLGVSLTSPGAARAVLEGGLYLTIVGLLGIGFGFIVRNTGGAIGALVGLILVVPLLAQALPSSWQNDIDKYLPMDIANRLIETVQPDSNALSPGAGIAVLFGYAVAVLAAGYLVLRRRDA